MAPVAGSTGRCMYNWSAKGRPEAGDRRLRQGGPSLVEILSSVWNMTL